MNNSNGYHAVDDGGDTIMIDFTPQHQFVPTPNFGDAAPQYDNSYAPIQFNQLTPSAGVYGAPNRDGTCHQASYPAAPNYKQPSQWLQQAPPTQQNPLPLYPVTPESLHLYSVLPGPSSHALSIVQPHPSEIIDQQSEPNPTVTQITSPLQPPQSDQQPDAEIEGLENEFSFLSLSKTERFPPRIDADKQRLPSKLNGYIKVDQRFELDSRFNMNRVPRLPSIFSQYSQDLDHLDRKVLHFCRSLMPKSNGWLTVYCPLAQKDNAVMLGLLAFASGYVLRLSHSEVQRQKANQYYQRALKSVERALNTFDSIKPGDEAIVVTLLRIFWSDSIVNLQLRSSDCNENKRRSLQIRGMLQTAKRAMQYTDAKERYWLKKNIQTDSIRQSNANMLAFVELSGQFLTPLRDFKAEDLDPFHEWLLAGSDEEVFTIQGCHGLSPKLLHMISTITAVSYHGREFIGESLECFMQEVLLTFNEMKQVSELTPTFVSTNKLLRACKLNDQGLVSTVEEVVCLIAECWRLAGIIYLYARFARLPASHWRIQKPLGKLLKCIRRMPSDGPLFTAQSPLGAIFLAGLVCIIDVQRDMIRTWFAGVSQRNALSSVPPLWKLLQRLWRCIDESEVHHIRVKAKVPMHQRFAWWEVVAEQSYARNGTVYLI